MVHDVKSACCVSILVGRLRLGSQALKVVVVRNTVVAENVSLVFQDYLHISVLDGHPRSQTKSDCATCCQATHGFTMSSGRRTWQPQPLFGSACAYILGYSELILFPSIGKYVGRDFLLSKSSEW